MARRDPRSDTSRKVIDTAIGVLVGLRGCSPDEAFAELARAVHQIGIGIGIGMVVARKLAAAS